MILKISARKGFRADVITVERWTGAPVSVMSKKSLVDISPLWESVRTWRPGQAHPEVW